ncbi:DUF131 domain-containing protein [Candidatus Bathyarchaeota archaeon]|nr:DUF131 domain-containing protein [Candidatus Bathyarchaeota archaeon]RJS90383.1 MAG: DUF131 domain-containing protein [Candidatus Bathyarchaeota archaeon]
MSISSILFAAGLLAIIAGFLIILVSVFSMGRREGEARGFGILFIGPIPIVFGSGRGRMRVLTLLSIALLVLLLFFFLPHLSR